MLENTVVQAEIPPQLAESKYLIFFKISVVELEQTAATFFQGGRLTLTFNTPINIFL